MVPHRQPLEYEQVTIQVITCDLNFLVEWIGLRPGILQARANITEIGRRDPQELFFEEEPHDTTDDMGVDAQQEREEPDLSEGLRLSSEISLGNI